VSSSSYEDVLLLGHMLSKLVFDSHQSCVVAVQHFALQNLNLSIFTISSKFNY
jgi:hypothetical protein